ncbi:glycosyltransferase family 4 protein [Lachnospiraceae bacterium 48-21]
MDSEVVLFGAGKRCKNLCRILRQTNIKIVSIIDSDPYKQGRRLEGYEISAPNKMKYYLYCNLCITVADYYTVNQIRRKLKDWYHYELDREISYNELIIKAYNENFEVNNMILNNIFYNKRESTILFDCCYGLDLGGIESWTIDLCGNLLKDGIKDIYIISDNGDYQVPELIEKQIICVDIEHDVGFSMSSILHITKNIMKRMPCKVVTRTTDEVMLAAYLIKKHYPDKIEVISVIHGGNERIYKEYIDFRECTDIYVAVSLDIKEEMISRGVESGKIYSMTCPFSCTPTLERNYTEDISLPIRIGYAGRMENSQKRMDLLVELIKVLEKKGICYYMELAGDGLAKKELENFIIYNKLCEKVCFLGRLERTDLPAFWKRQDICVNLADYEGRSISIIEAMGNGVVPVVTRTSGVREDILDGLNGYIVPLGDYHTMAARIAFLYRHREKLHMMGKLAHDVVYPKSLMEPHIEFWKKILNLK